MKKEGNRYTEYVKGWCKGTYPSEILAKLILGQNAKDLVLVQPHLYFSHLSVSVCHHSNHHIQQKQKIDKEV